MRGMSEKSLARRTAIAGAVVLLLLLMSLIAVFNQVKGQGLSWHEAHYWPELQAIAGGTAPDHTQYRLLSNAATVGFCRTLEALGVPRAIGVGLILVRILQNLLLFSLLLAYGKKLGVSLYSGLLGSMLLAWGMTQARHTGGLDIDLYSEILLYLTVALVMSTGRARWLPLLCAAGALNRESAILMPVMALLTPPSASGKQKNESRFRATAICASIYIAVQLGLRAQFGIRDGLFDAYSLAMLKENLLFNFQTPAVWGSLVGTLSIAPILALTNTRSWPPLLIKIMLLVGIPWIIACLLLLPLTGSAHLFLPLALVFIPAMLRNGDSNAFLHEMTRPKPLLSLLKLVTVPISCIVVLSVFNIYYQVNLMGTQGGLAWYERVQWERTVQVMHNQQGTPWQYRLFTDAIVYGTVRSLEALHMPRPIGTGFVLIRLIQNLALFSLAVLFYRRLGLKTETALLGIALLAAGMCHGLYDTDMTFNTYTDISLFLIAGLLILSNRIRWIIPLMLVAALNRETSGCIPFMLLFSRIEWDKKPRVSRETLVVFAVSLALWVIIVGGMRLPFVFGMKPYIVPTAGKKPILPLLLFNLTWWRTWVFLFATLGILPLLGLASWRAWPVTLRRYFWAIVPVWFPLHFSLAHAPETRLFLVPQVLLFIPAALLGIGYWATRPVAAPEQARNTPRP